MGWQDQGRQEHGWFGHDTAGRQSDSTGGDGDLFGRQGLGLRIRAVAHGASASLPSALRRRTAAQFDADNLSKLNEVMTAWIAGARLDPTSFAERFFGRPPNDPLVAKLRSAAQGADMARSHAELRAAAGQFADAIQAIGLDRWPRFLADAQDRARDPATIAAVENSRLPSDPGKDAIRPVYPVETALGIAAAGIAGGAVAALRAAGGAALRQVVPARVSAVGIETPADVLKPGGQPIGRTGSSEEIRELSGGQAAAEKLFQRLTKGGTDVTPAGHPGTLMEMPNGGYIGYRAQSKSGPPTIDITQPGIEIRKLKFPGN